MSVSNFPPRVCAYCRETFVPQSSDKQRYCNRTCAGYGRRRPFADRFWEKVDKNGPIPVNRPELGPCWVWTGAINKDTGYGMFNANVRIDTPHRVSYGLTVAPIPDGLHIDHLCRNHACCNPKHLEAVTPRENMIRGDLPQVIAIRSGYCKRGHPRTPENLYVYASGCKACGICAAERYQRSKANV